MKIIIAGAGAVGTHLAQLLAKESQNITLIDESEDKLSKVADNVDLMTLNVKPTSISGLKEAGAAHAELFIAVMPDEMKNITCCMLAHTLGAQKTVARIDNAEYLDEEYKTFFKNMGISSLIFPEILAARDIIEGIKHSWVRQWWEVHDGALVMLGIKLRETAEHPAENTVRPGHLLPCRGYQTRRHDHHPERRCHAPTGRHRVFHDHEEIHSLHPQDCR